MPTKRGFRVEVRPNDSRNDMWRILLFPMEFDEDRRYWTGQGCTGGSDHNALSHLVLEAWGYNESRKLSYRFEYSLMNIYSASTREIAAMHKLMSGIERFLAKERDLNGDALSFGQWCLRVAKAVKASAFLLPKLNAHNYEPNERWHIRSLAEGQAAIDDEIRRWQEHSDEQAT